MRGSLFLLLMMVVGCTPIKEIPIKTVERKVTTLVPYAVPGDSATLTALFECDSMNSVILRDLREEKSKNVQSKIDFENGVLNYNAKTGLDTIYLPSDTIYIEKEVPMVVKVPVIEYRQTGFQHFLSWVGVLALIISLFWGIVRLKFRN